MAARSPRDLRGRPVFFYSRKEIPFGIFSNFFNAPILVNGDKFPTVEHFYQASKAANVTDYETVRRSRSPEEAKILAGRMSVRADWSQVRLGVMYRALLAKFHQHPKLARILVSTDGCSLHEQSDDLYWGWANGAGEDWLGLLLMTVREQMLGQYGRLNLQSVKTALAGSFASGYQVAAGIRQSRHSGGVWFTHMVRESLMPAQDTLQLILESRQVLPLSRFREGSEYSAWNVSSLACLAQKCFGVERELREQERANIYTAYGVALPYTVGRDFGLQPAIPIEPQHVNKLPADLHYRIQFYSPHQQYDWTHENEWRASSPVDVNPRVAVVIAPDREDLASFATSSEDNWRVIVLRDHMLGNR